MNAIQAVIAEAIDVVERMDRDARRDEIIAELREWADGTSDNNKFVLWETYNADGLLGPISGKTRLIASPDIDDCITRISLERSMRPDFTYQITYNGVEVVAMIEQLAGAGGGS